MPLFVLMFEKACKACATKYGQLAAALENTNSAVFETFRFFPFVLHI